MLRPEVIAERFRQTVDWCALKELDSEFPYDGQLLARKLREEKWSEAELQAHCILSRPLRSPELRPAFQDGLQVLARWTPYVDEVAAKRGVELRNRENRMPSNARGGRFVVYAPEDNLADGASEVMSLGFFDVDNVPPWDTWVAMVDRYLLAWVPPQLLKPANDGIEVNPEECIMWADNKLISKTLAAHSANMLETTQK